MSKFSDERAKPVQPYDIKRALELLSTPDPEVMGGAKPVYEANSESGKSGPCPIGEMIEYMHALGPIEVARPKIPSKD